METLTAVAELLGRRLRESQLDRSGRPLVEHIARVAATTRHRRRNDDDAEARDLLLTRPETSGWHDSDGSGRTAVHHC